MKYLIYLCSVLRRLRKPIASWGDSVRLQSRSTSRAVVVGKMVVLQREKASKKGLENTYKVHPNFNERFVATLPIRLLR